MGTLLVAVPLGQVRLDPEAFAQVAEDLLLGGAALIHDHTQHLGDTALVEGVLFHALDQLLIDLEICEVHQCLEKIIKILWPLMASAKHVGRGSDQRLGILTLQTPDKRYHSL